MHRKIIPLLIVLLGVGFMSYEVYIMSSSASPSFAQNASQTQMAGILRSDLGLGNTGTTIIRKDVRGDENDGNICPDVGTADKFCSKIPIASCKGKNGGPIEYGLFKCKVVGEKCVGDGRIETCEDLSTVNNWCSKCQSKFADKLCYSLHDKCYSGDIYGEAAKCADRNRLDCSKYNEPSTDTSNIPDPRETDPQTRCNSAPQKGIFKCQWINNQCVKRDINKSCSEFKNAESCGCASKVSDYKDLQCSWNGNSCSGPFENPPIAVVITLEPPIIITPGEVVTDYTPSPTQTPTPTISPEPTPTNPPWYCDILPFICPTPTPSTTIIPSQTPTLTPNITVYPTTTIAPTVSPDCESDTTGGNKNCPPVIIKCTTDKDCSGETKYCIKPDANKPEKNFCAICGGDDGNNQCKATFPTDPKRWKCIGNECTCIPKIGEEEACNDTTPTPIASATITPEATIIYSTPTPEPTYTTEPTRKYICGSAMRPATAPT